MASAAGCIEAVERSADGQQQSALGALGLGDFDGALDGRKSA